MRMINPTEDQSGCVPNDTAEKIEAIAQSLLMIFGDRAPAVIARQADASTEAIRLSWTAILACVNRMLVTRQE